MIYLFHLPFRGELHKQPYIIWRKHQRYILKNSEHKIFGEIKKYGIEFPMQICAELNKLELDFIENSCFLFI